MSITSTSASKMRTMSITECNRLAFLLASYIRRRRQALAMSVERAAELSDCITTLCSRLTPRSARPQYGTSGASWWAMVRNWSTFGGTTPTAERLDTVSNWWDRRMGTSQPTMTTSTLLSGLFVGTRTPRHAGGGVDSSNVVPIPNHPASIPFIP
jgi:hypothetical protein